MSEILSFLYTEKKSVAHEYLLPSGQSAVVLPALLVWSQTMSARIYVVNLMTNYYIHCIVIKVKGLLFSRYHWLNLNLLFVKESPHLFDKFVICPLSS